MIPAKRLIIEFDRRFDRFASEYKKNLRLEDKISVLNEAHEKIFENRVSIAEVNSELRNDLRNFEMKDISLQKIRVSKDYTVFSFPKDYYKMLRIKCIAEKKSCGKKEIPVIIFQADDLEEALKDDFWKPSFEWETVLGDEGSEGIYLWHQETFSITNCIIDYYRKIKDIQCASLSKDGFYRDFNDNLINYDQGCEMDSTYLWQTVVDLAVLIARADIGDDRDFKIQNEKLFLKDKT